MSHSLHIDTSHKSESVFSFEFLLNEYSEVYEERRRYFNGRRREAKADKTSEVGSSKSIEKRDEERCSNFK
ncbi:hypothetical protein MA16_Dca027020 [Dendrobium catenatum]|uniref:Uncharacterized protein n=1 Tax=Dendrobium catenatum TaxID=906689 RepID=A0A2I0WRH6_9ASPA|nr:hypothetical protein MA16_Dca027020 [Dendrobium catenatum]